jgi:biopolymer transport protein ExbB
MMYYFILQITTGIISVDESVVSDAKSMSIIDLVLRGGIFMIPIFLLSFLAIFILLERFLTIKKATKNHKELLHLLTAHIKSGDIKNCLSIAQQHDTALARMISKGIKKIGNPIKTIESAMENAGKIEVMRLEKNMAYLGIVAAIAPMFGFVGTISGVIKIFYNISLQDNISIGLIAGGLYEKMVTSAAGLLVGIIAYIGYHLLNMMLDNVVLIMETSAAVLMDVLTEEK